MTVTKDELKIFLFFKLRTLYCTMYNSLSTIIIINFNLKLHYFMNKLHDCSGANQNMCWVILGFYLNE